MLLPIFQGIFSPFKEGVMKNYKLASKLQASDIARNDAKNIMNVFFK